MHEIPKIWPPISLLRHPTMPAMSLLIMLGLVLTLMTPVAVKVPASGLQLAASAGAYALGVTALALWARRGLDADGRIPEARVGPFLRRRRVAAVLLQVWIVAGAAGLLAIGWTPRIAGALGVAGWPLVDALISLTPFVLAVVWMWTLSYRHHLFIRRRLAERLAWEGRPVPPYWTRRQYLVFSLRHHLLFVLVPIGLMIFLSDVLNRYAAPAVARTGLWNRLSDRLAGWGVDLPARDLADLAFGIGIVVVALTVFLVAPMLVVWIWRTRSLGAGPLREHLAGLCRRLRIGFRDIRVWISDGVLANAAAMGLVGRVRYFLISDALLDEMEPPEVEAVFAHEAGHAKANHLFYCGLFAVSAALVSLAAAGALVSLVPALAGQEQYVALPLLVAAWAFGFGYVSRRFERHADVLAAWLIGPGDGRDGVIDPDAADTFARALERIGVLNGMSLRQRNWRHGRLIDRIAYVRHLGLTGGTRRDIDRRVRQIKVALWLGLLVGLGVLVGGPLLLG